MAKRKKKGGRSADYRTKCKELTVELASTKAIAGRLLMQAESKQAKAQAEVESLRAFAEGVARYGYPGTLGERAGLVEVVDEWVDAARELTGVTE